MNESKQIREKMNRAPASRSLWYWFWGAFLLMLVLLAITAIPFIKNARAIQQVKSLGGNVTTRPGVVLNLLPASWQSWLVDSLSESNLFALQTVTKVSFSYDTIQDRDLICLRDFHSLEYLAICHAKEINGAGLVYLKRMPNLKEIDLEFSTINDAGLVHLKNLTTLQRLDLGNTNVSDAGLVHLKGLVNLEYIDLWDANTGDVGISHLAGLTKLKILLLEDTYVSIASVVHFKKMTQLKELDVRGTKFTRDEINQLKTIFPKCWVKD